MCVEVNLCVDVKDITFSLCVSKIYQQTLAVPQTVDAPEPTDSASICSWTHRFQQVREWLRSGSKSTKWADFILSYLSMS